jgi:hypothetical protein
MLGETVSDLLRPLIGRSGSVTLLVRRSGSIGFDMTENKKLTGVEVRPDGLIRLERQSGWTVLDPDGTARPRATWASSCDRAPVSNCRRRAPPRACGGVGPSPDVLARVSDDLGPD